MPPLLPPCLALPAHRPPLVDCRRRSWPLTPPPRDRLCRSVKKETLKLIETYVSHATRDTHVRAPARPSHPPPRTVRSRRTSQCGLHLAAWLARRAKLCVLHHYRSGQVIADTFVPPLLDPVLGDYLRNAPDARDPEVLSLLACIVNTCKEAVTPKVPEILGA